MIHYEDAQVKLLLGEVRAVLSKLPAKSVHCVVTSPPYWGLRDYGIPPSVWGGRPRHAHDWRKAPKDKARWVYEAKVRWPHAVNGDGREEPNMPMRSVVDIDRGGFCDCGAWMGSLGLEPTPALYIEHLAEVFRAVWRVLRDDGTCWLNLGDSYAAKPRGSDNGWDKSRLTNPGQVQKRQAASLRRGRDISAYKEKDLIGVPWLAAFALQREGWYLRSDIIWSKPNPMPESVTDRPTKAHEYLFLLAKSERYFYDAEAIREPYRYGRDHRRHADIPPESHMPGAPEHTGLRRSQANGNKRRKLGEEMNAGRLNDHMGVGFPWFEDERGRNRRTVWEITTEPYPSAHFATFPTELVKPCILAGTSAHGVCARCSAPYVRELEAERTAPSAPSGNREIGRWSTEDDMGQLGGRRQVRTIGWKPSCSCEERDLEPATVLDPFAGSGTTCFVAKEHGRKAIGVDLKPEYLELAVERVRQQTLWAPL